MATDEYFPDIESRLNGATARIHWHELQRYFARGVVRQVSTELDLIEVGKRIIANDTEQVQRWRDHGQLLVPDDGTARQWYENNLEVWALVIAPWVLVQLLKE